jgi:nicotinamidase/pyrazinamidase
MIADMYKTFHRGERPGDRVELPGTGPQALRPDHCVQGSFGAACHEKLDLAPVHLVLRRGFRTGPVPSEELP